MTTPPASRGITGLLVGIVGGAASMALFSAAITHPQTMLIFLAYMSVIPLLLAGLGAGVIGALVAAGVGIAALVATLPVNVAFVYTTIYAVPAVLLTMLALRWPAAGKAGDAPVEGNILAAITLYPCVIFLTVAAAMATQDGGLLAVTNRLLDAATAPLKTELDPDTAALFTATMGHLVRMLPALIGCSWMLVMILSLIVAQAALQQQNWHLRPAFSLQAVHVPNWVIFAAAIAGLCGTLAPPPYDYMGGNLCFMLCVPFFFVGIAIVHAWAATTKARIAALVTFYILLALPWTMFPASISVLVLGIVDQWVNFRQRFAAGSKQGGN